MKPRAVRILARLGVLAVACALLAAVTVQYVRIVERNIAYERSLHEVQREVTQLEARRDDQLREIRRLGDPVGSIPEIHDRLHLVSDREEIIYLKRPHD